MENCWANQTGDCCGQISREHLISESLFLEPKVSVHGFTWCKEEPKIIGLSSMTSKILCKKHNSDLSPVDTVGAQAFNAFRESAQLNNIRGKLKPRRWRVQKYTIDGRLLERWFLKTTINLLSLGNIPIGKNSTRLGKPSGNLVDIAFGRNDFHKPAGLYASAFKGETINSRDVVQFAPLIKDQTHVSGALFFFRGFRFLLMMDMEEPPKSLADSNFYYHSLEEHSHNYHLKNINWKHDKYLSTTIQFRW